MTGGSRGIGRAIVLAFAGLGCQVTFCYRSDRTAAEAVCQEAAGRGWQVTAVKADVGFSEEAQRLVDGVLAQHGRIDILVNNAGVFPRRARSSRSTMPSGRR